MKKFLLGLSDLLAVVWRIVPTRIRHGVIKGIFVLESRDKNPGAGLSRLFAVEDDLTHVINERAMAFGNGTHPKHRLIGYHQYFIDRITDGEKVLDVGCGMGAVARSIARARPGSKVVGMDNDPGRLGKAKASDNPPNLSFVEGDATRTSPEGPWDVVVLSNVLEHIADREGFLRALAKATEAKRFLIRLPLFERDWTLPMRRELGANYYSDPDHKIEPTREDLRRELTNSGFELTELQTIWGEIWAIARPRGAATDELSSPEGSAIMPEPRAPKVSVVVPCYNGGRFLSGLVDTLDAQTFRDFEVILIDDGSTDAATAAAIASLPASIKVVSQSNQGLPAARNTGFAAARGEYVLPLDCDDRLAVCFLERATAMLDARQGRGFVFADMLTQGDFRTVLERRYNRFDQLFVNRIPYCCLMPRAAWQEAGGYDVNMTGGFEDWEFNVRLQRHGYFGIRIDRPLFLYEVSQSGMLLSRSARTHASLWRAIRRRNAKLYTWSGLRRQWTAAADDGERSRIGFSKGLALLFLARVAPDRLVNYVFFKALQRAHARHSNGDESGSGPSSASIAASSTHTPGRCVVCGQPSCGYVEQRSGELAQ